MNDVKQKDIDVSSGWIADIKTKTDYITVTQAIDLDAVTGGSPPVHLIYANLAAMYADQGNQKTGFLYKITGGNYYHYLGTTNGDDTDYDGAGVIEETMIFPLSDFSSTQSIGTNKARFPVPWDCTLIEAQGYCVSENPSGANFIIDVNVVGSTSIMADLITIEDGEQSSLTATTQPTFQSATLSKGNILSFDFDLVGSTNSGKGIQVVLIVTRS